MDNEMNEKDLDAPLRWYESETTEGGFSAELDGFTADVEPPDEEHGIHPWFWRVDATSSVSEWPELQDCGTCTTLEKGKVLAETAIRKAVASRKGAPFIVYD